MHTTLSSSHNKKTIIVKYGNEFESVTRNRQLQMSSVTYQRQNLWINPCLFCTQILERNLCSFECFVCKITIKKHMLILFNNSLSILSLFLIVLVGWFAFDYNSCHFCQLQTFRMKILDRENGLLDVKYLGRMLWKMLKTCRLT